MTARGPLGLPRPFGVGPLTKRRRRTAFNRVSGCDPDCRNGLTDEALQQRAIEIMEERDRRLADDVATYDGEVVGVRVIGSIAKGTFGRRRDAEIVGFHAMQTLGLFLDGEVDPMRAEDALMNAGETRADPAEICADLQDDFGPDHPVTKAWQMAMCSDLDGDILVEGGEVPSLTEDERMTTQNVAAAGDVPREPVFADRLTGKLFGELNETVREVADNHGFDHIEVDVTFDNPEKESDEPEIRTTFDPPLPR